MKIRQMEWEKTLKLVGKRFTLVGDISRRQVIFHVGR